MLIGGKLAYKNGRMTVPQAPGLGIELDDAKLAEYEFTVARKVGFDALWAETKARYAIPPVGRDLLVRHY